MALWLHYVPSMHAEKNKELPADATTAPVGVLFARKLDKRA